MDLKQQALALRGTRVKARVAGETVEAELRYVTPSGEVIFAGEGGHPVRYPLASLESIEDARLSCASCGVRVNVLHAGREDSTLLCTDCSRQRAFRLDPPVMSCPECGAEPAFYSPGDKTYACAVCHGKRKGLTGLGVELRVMETAHAADCRAADIHSDLHSWKRVKGNHVCRKCQVKTHLLPTDW